MNYIFSSIFLMLIAISASGQKKMPIPKGKLFIIGGGDRPPSLMKSLVVTADLSATDYVVVLPMSSEEPDTSFFYFKEDLQPVCQNKIIEFNFTKEKVNDKNWLDSLEHARLIFITGGDQDRFMKIVFNTPVFQAIHKAYTNGATISGTSAGAAVMSQHMITGSELTDTTYRATFKKLHQNNIVIKEGLGLITSAVIDQHFIVRSRYNRLLSAIAKYPLLACIGIDETTAIIVRGNNIEVAGEGQVIVFKHPKELKVVEHDLIKVKSLQLSIYTKGDTFTIGTSH